MAQVIDLQERRTVPRPHGEDPAGPLMAIVAHTMSDMEAEKPRPFTDAALAIATLDPLGIQAVSDFVVGRTRYTPSRACDEVQLTILAVQGVLARAPLSQQQVTQFEEVHAIVQNLNRHSQTEFLARAAASLMRAAHMLPDSPGLNAWFCSTGDTLHMLRTTGIAQDAAWTALGRLAGSLRRVVLTTFTSR